MGKSFRSENEQTDTPLSFSSTASLGEHTLDLLLVPVLNVVSSVPDLTVVHFGLGLPATSPAPEKTIKSWNHDI